MKKILLVLLSLFSVLIFTGCGGPSPKEEAKQFNETYYVQGFKKELMAEFRKTMNDAITKHGNSEEADKAIIASGIPQKFKDSIEKIKQAKIENKEVEPLKNKLIKIEETFIALFDIVEKNDANNVDQTLKNKDKAEFDYENEYSKITTGKGLPVFNTPIGQLYAEEASNVLFTITNVSEAKTVGSGYFQKAAQGKFIIVKVMISNNQKDAITVDSNSFVLIDSQSRKFSTSVEGMTAVQISENHTKGFLTKLNPGMVIDSTFVYDVPTNLKISDFELEARGGMTGDKVKMPLAVRKTGY